MSSALSTITIGVDPTIEVGPLTIAWHGVTIALGILAGALAAGREARRLGLKTEPLYTIAMIVVASALVGGRLFYLAEHGALLDSSAWLASRGFTFYGGFIVAAIGIGVYVWIRRLSVRYLDAAAFGLPLGIAIGRIGDVINGEHYGPATDFVLGVRNTHPDADVPSPDVAYHSGGLYEVLIGAVAFAIVLLLRRRLSRPTAMTWLVIALLAAGRFVEFFVRSDSDELALGLEIAQWTSLALLVVAGAGAWLTLGRRRPRRPTRAARALNLSTVPVLAAIAALAFVPGGCLGDDPSSERRDAAAPDPAVGDPGPVHVHGLGVDPADDSLYIATHTGLFRQPRGQDQARRVADRYQDTMGFAVIGPRRFLGSGHPDGREGLPPFLGLIASSDAGRTWKPVSLLGKIDFHVLEPAGSRIYGFGSDFRTRRERMLVSSDGGRSWSAREAPESLVSLAIDPQDRGRVVASGETALYASDDSARRWRTLRGPVGLLAWGDGGSLYLVDRAGTVSVSADAGAAWTRAGEIGGQPAAFEAVGLALYAALHDGTIKLSRDRGRSWAVISRP
jgi:phosphatidylglycerol:prolipoprotein diacylglycerol transferase